MVCTEPAVSRGTGHVTMKTALQPLLVEIQNALCQAKVTHSVLHTTRAQLVCSDAENRAIAVIVKALRAHLEMRHSTGVHIYTCARARACVCVCVCVYDTPSTAFRHLPPNSARFSYATEGARFISAQLSTDAVSALRKVWVLPITLWKQPSAQART